MGGGAGWIKEIANLRISDVTKGQKELKETAENGLKLCKLLYNEASRIRRLYNKGNAINSLYTNCCARECQLNQKKD